MYYSMFSITKHYFSTSSRFDFGFTKFYGQRKTRGKKNAYVLNLTSTNQR